jgi:hypothetical protein
MYLCEDVRFPGGFTKMITEKLNFTQKNPFFGEMITVILVLLVAVLPLILWEVKFLTIAPMFLGILEAVAHLLAIKMFNSKKPYSPGLITALFLLFPIAVYTFFTAIRQHLLPLMDYLFAFLYILFSLLLAQRIVINASGMKYKDFLSNVKGTLFKK